MIEEPILEECAAMLAIKILGRKWTTNILCELLIHKEMFFSQLQDNIEGQLGEKISARVLSEALTRLEELDIVNREVISETMPIRVKYSLTEKGEDFQFIFAVLKGWGVKWGGLKIKKCRSFSCLHNAVPYLDLEKIAEHVTWEPLTEKPKEKHLEEY